MEKENNEKFKNENLSTTNGEIILQKGEKFCLDDFDILKELGNGAYAKVYLCLSKKDKKEYALKSFGKNSMIKENKLYQVFVESELMINLRNDYITRAYSAFEENKRMILVLDYFKNGDLFDFISVNSKFFIML